MTKKIECPVCGSDKVQTTKHVSNYLIPYSVPVLVEEEVYSCMNCGVNGDFNQQSLELDPRVENAIKAAEKKSVSEMLGYLSQEKGISMAYLERALSLSQRTTSRWKNEECSQAVVALVRILRTYPWILKVAESGFDSLKADQALILATSEAFLSISERISVEGVVVDSLHAITVSSSEDKTEFVHSAFRSISRKHVQNSNEDVISISEDS